MPHIALLGDSIFDNAAYVGDNPSVIEQLQSLLDGGWEASLRAVDGSLTQDVHAQIRYLPKIVTHLVISSGGNDALAQLPMLETPAHSMPAALARLADIHEHFAGEYRAMIGALMKLGLPVAVCTIYEDVPGLSRNLKVGLHLFNDVIIREASRARVPVIDLRLICTDFADYSTLSPIEPSSQGGMKIATAIRRFIDQGANSGLSQWI